MNFAILNKQPVIRLELSPREFQAVLNALKVTYIKIDFPDLVKDMEEVERLVFP